MEKIVFVLGAGASKEFDQSGAMPIGSELANQIQTLMDEEIRGRHTANDGPISLSFMSTGGLTNIHFDAMQRIRDGIHSKNSIDDFIDEWQDRPQVQSVALRSIAHCILEAEKRSLLGRVEKDQSNAAAQLSLLRTSWLGQTVRSIRPSERRRDLAAVLENVAFITFNYDRCIEAYLYYYAVNTLAMPAAEAMELIRAIPIIHVYGSLGDLNGISGTVPFGAADPQRLASAAAGIRTYTQSLDERHRTSIQTTIAGADKLLLLGIGYHRQNLDILFGSKWTGQARIWATTLNLRPRMQQEVTSYFNDPTNSSAMRFEQDVASSIIDRYSDDIF